MPYVSCREVNAGHKWDADKRTPGQSDTSRVLIVGAGGHGLIVADILLCARAHRRAPDGLLDPGGGAGLGTECGSRFEGVLDPIGFLDDDPRLAGTRVLGLPVLGTREGLSSIPHDALVVAIGDNATREAVSRQLERDGARLITACHPHAHVASDVEIGPGCMLSAGVVVTPGTRLGRGVILNTSCSVDHQSVIGDFAHIAPGVTVGGQVTIGPRTLVGLGASVMSGLRIGADTVVGAGALVAADLPDRVVAMGVPARITRELRD